MTRRRIILIALIGLILGGCLGDKPIEEEAHLPQESNEVIGNPPALSVIAQNVSTFALLDTFCWNNEESTCVAEPDQPQKVVEKSGQAGGGVQSPVISKQGGNITFASSSTLEGDFTSPDNFDVLQVYKGEESVVEVTGNIMMAPTEKGRYFYSVTARWDGDVKGEAIYVFSLLVK